MLKPERTLSNLEGHHAIGVQGWPAFNKDGKYTGPLPNECPHGGHESVGGRGADGTFATKKLATFSRPFNQYIAALLVNSAILKRIGSLFEAGKMVTEPITEPGEMGQRKRSLPCLHPLTDGTDTAPHSPPAGEGGGPPFTTERAFAPQGGGSRQIEAWTTREQLPE